MRFVLEIPFELQTKNSGIPPSGRITLLKHFELLIFCIFFWIFVVFRTLAKFQSGAATFGSGVKIVQDAHDPAFPMAKAYTHTHCNAFGCKSAVLCLFHFCLQGFYKKLSVQGRLQQSAYHFFNVSPIVRIWFYWFIDFLLFCIKRLLTIFPFTSRRSTKQRCLEFWFSRKHIANHMRFAHEMKRKKPEKQKIVKIHNF